MGDHYKTKQKCKEYCEKMPELYDNIDECFEEVKVWECSKYNTL
jgi:hypothetical protein